MEKETNNDTVSEVLRDAANFFEERNAVYEFAYREHGPIMEKFFPNGINLNSSDDFFQYHCFVMKVIKMTRMAKKMAKGEFHKDSHLDDIIYGAMALEGKGGFTNEEK